MGRQSSKGVGTPKGAPEPTKGGGRDIRSKRACPEVVGDPAGEWPSEDTSELLDQVGTKRYQSVAALLNFTALDRPELLYPVKELMRKMANPSMTDESHLKRVLRFLRTLPRMVAMYKWDDLATDIEIYADADHAGCCRTRKSTLGGVVLWGVGS